MPILIIHKPKNETYLANSSLLLNYTASYEDAVWYNLDSGENTTVSSESYFNTSEGSHMLYLYANNSLGTQMENVTFNVNLTQFTIHSDEYDGNSTNFNEYSSEDIQNLSGIILEDVLAGKIVFNEAINLTDDANLSDYEVDLDGNINISSSRIELDSDVLTNFNKSATLHFYGLTLSVPRILRDDVVCPASICTQRSYSGGILIFNVTGFTAYSVDETPAAETPAEDETTGGGGGGVSSSGCNENSDCEGDEICWKGKCVELFDIKIIDFESPVQLGDFFEFTYFAKGVANINADVEVRFWIEKDKEVVTSGSDIMYFGNFEEKTETTKIFLPSSLDSGLYEFYVQVIHEAYIVDAHRSIEIEVKEDGTATIKAIDEEPKTFLILISIFVTFLFVLFLILVLRRKKSKNHRTKKQRFRGFKRIFK